jgi:flavin-dependent dehydrogenase
MAGNVVVVGGGLSGLAAAWRLERAGVSTTVLEADERPGVQLAGDLFGAGSMESAVRWGERAADRLVSGALRGVPVPSSF